MGYNGFPPPPVGPPPFPLCGKKKKMWGSRTFRSWILSEASTILHNPCCMGLRPNVRYKPPVDRDDLRLGKGGKPTKAQNYVDLPNKSEIRNQISQKTKIEVLVTDLEAP